MTEATRDQSMDVPPVFALEDPELVVPESATLPLGAMISVRFDAATVRRIRRAANLDGLTQSEFVRRAAIASAERRLEREPVPTIANAHAYDGGSVPPIVRGSRDGAVSTETTPQGSFEVAHSGSFVAA